MALVWVIGGPGEIYPIALEALSTDVLPFSFPPPTTLPLPVGFTAYITDTKLERRYDGANWPTQALDVTMISGVVSTTQHGSQPAITNAHAHTDLSGVTANQHHASKEGHIPLILLATEVAF